MMVVMRIFNGDDDDDGDVDDYDSCMFEKVLGFQMVKVGSVDAIVGQTMDLGLQECTMGAADSFGDAVRRHEKAKVLRYWEGPWRYPKDS